MIRLKLRLVYNLELCESLSSPPHCLLSLRPQLTTRCWQCGARYIRHKQTAQQIACIHRPISATESCYQNWQERRKTVSCTKQSPYNAELEGPKNTNSYNIPQICPYIITNVSTLLSLIWATFATLHKKTFVEITQTLIVKKLMIINKWADSQQRHAIK